MASASSPLNMDENDSQQEVQRYLGLISSYEKQFKKWEGKVDTIIKRYRDEYRTGTRGYTESRFNILWSNVQTAMPAVYSQLPKPDVARRFKDSDPVGRVASLILERGLSYEVEHYHDYANSLKQAVLDRFLGGRGTVWVRYEPHIVSKQREMPEDGLSVTEDTDEPETYEELEYECCPVDYVHWKDFGHQVARTWEEVGVVWRKVYMPREALVERFGEEIGNRIPLDTAPDDLNKKTVSGGTDSESAEALIYEIWDKPRGIAVWISKSLGKIVDQKQDPYGLDEFFPCPKPLYATLTNESLDPIPDFKLYQDQANQLDILSDRIDGLIKALQVKGVYNSTFTELARLFTEGENNTLIPVKDWTAFAEKNGMRGAIDLVDIQPIAQALLAAYNAMEQVKGQVHEITGLSDIIRGQSVASETATAQKIKGQYASLRLKDMQSTVSEFAAQIIRIKAQIMCKLFQPESLVQFASGGQLQPVDQQMIGPAVELLQSNIRDFRIDIEADSLVQMDEQQEKQNRLEFIQATSSYLEKVAGAAQTSPALAPLAMELLKFGVSAFKAGKTMEGVIDQTIEQMKQQAAQPKPDPKAAELQAEQAKLQFQAQIDAQKEQFIAQREAAENEQQRKHDEQIELMQLTFDKWKEELAASVKIQVANIGAAIKVNNSATNISEMEIAREIQ